MNLHKVEILEILTLICGGPPPTDGALNMDPKLSKNGLKTFIRCLDQLLEEIEAPIKCGNFGQKC